MCFEAEIDLAKLDGFIAYASEFLRQESAEGADPGLCVAHIDGNPASLGPLIDFGQRAKREVLTKREAYDLAFRHGIHLSEHGGTGDGVIGALAGTGLRVSGNDGRVRGKLKIGNENTAVSVATIRSHGHVDTVRSIYGNTLQDDELVRLGDKMKAVLLDGGPVLLVSPEEPAVDGINWRVLSKQELKSF
jgi:hypothetical protein